MCAKQSLIDDEPKYSHQSVLIVGGGPAGLATALMLAKRGWKNITVLEQRSTADYYEPDKSFNYLIDGRGQKFTDYLELTPKLSTISVSTQDFYLTRIAPDGSRKSSKLPIIDPKRKTSYWITRKAFVRMLYQEIEQNWQHFIQVRFNAKCIEINKIPINQEENKLEVIAEVGKDNFVRFTPSLLVGCDGLRSVVRNTLAEWDTSALNKFQMQIFPSDSAGLRYKVLSLPPKPSLDHNGEEYAVSEMAYMVLGALHHPQRYLRLGILPVKDPEEPRTANIIAKPDHEVWDLKDADAIYSFFNKSFPQLPLDKILAPEEADRFAKSEGGYFPKPQYCSGLQFLLRQPANQDTLAIGVVLLGDTIHCFPPDIGQGVNAALEDVLVLDKALSQTHDDISQALPLYESLRVADTKALIKLVQIAFPWQYGQDPFRTKLWSIKFFFKLVLSRFLPFLFSPPAFFLVQNYRLSYQEILSKVKRTNQILYVLGLIILCGFLVVSDRWLHSS
jgi:2-polyprenyl-6-methoxyphenol hydroxylase-like FAD-dependent oxidoreductase